MLKTLIRMSSLLCFLAGISAINSTQAQTYQPWPGNQSNAQLNQMIKDLRQLVRRAEADRAADPTFLRDLKKLADKYQSGQNNAEQPSPETTTERVFFDDFGDGEFNANPTWKVSAGSWAIDRSGQNIGLVSKVGRPLSANNILGALLTPQGSSQNQYASIYSQTRIPAAFSIHLKLTSKDLFGALNISPYQGSSGQNSYRLVYKPGNGMELQLVQGQKAQSIGSFGGALNLEDGRLHDIIWTRDAYGRMTINVDNRKIISAADSSLQGDFSGILFINSGGAYWIRSVEISGQ